MVNAHVIYQECNANDRTFRRHPSKFWLELITGLIQGWTWPLKKIDWPSSSWMPARLTEHMEHVLVPIPGWNTNFKPNETDCVMCSEQSTSSRHRTSWMCGHCSIPLCLHPCFHSATQWKTLIKSAVMTRVTIGTKWCQSRRDPPRRGPKLTVASWPFLYPTILGRVLHWDTKDSKTQGWE